MKLTKLEQQAVSEYEPQLDFLGRTVGVFVLLRPGYKFEPEGHCSGFDTMAEARRYVKTDVSKCDCEECKELLAS